MESWTDKLAALPAAQRGYMEYLTNTLPKSDRDSYPFGLFAKACAHAAMLRRDVPWCRAYTEQVFLDYVLCPRVNDEDLSGHRELFYSELWPRVKGLKVNDAVLEVNRWCHEKATYQQQDDRTASPLTVYKNGSGRCGEQSALAVSALRSVGIAARQVYAPRWAHCDDNHAWVEALCDGQWHFFGACEPEPVLDRGWFNAAASRAVLVHTRRFVQRGAPVSGADGAPLDRAGAAQYYNQTARYARTQRYAFCVMHKGRPVQGAVVEVQVLNGAELCPVLTLFTNEKGEASAELGRGDICLHARHALGEAQLLCAPPQGGPYVLELATHPAPDGGWRDFDFAPPSGGDVYAAALTGVQKQSRMAQLAHGNAVRSAAQAAKFNTQRAAALGGAVLDILQEARGNFTEIAAFLEAAPADPLRPALLRSLAAKDLRDIPCVTLEDHLAGAAPYAGRYPGAVYTQYLLCPRVATERITPWRTALAAAFDAAQRADFAQKPAALWQWLCQKVEPEYEGTYPNLFWPPDAAFEAGRWDKKSRAVLFCALLRSWGVPARLNAWDATPEYWAGGNFVPVKQRKTATLTLTKQAGQSFVYHVHWTLARHRADGGWQTLELSMPMGRGVPEEQGAPGWREDKWLALALPVGEYRIITTVRMPGGNQFASCCTFALEKDMALAMRQRGFAVQDLLIEQPLPTFGAKRADDTYVENPCLGGGRCTLLFWLEPGAEPTEHVLNELLEARDDIATLPANLVFFVRDKETLRGAAISRVLEALPGIHVLYGEWEHNIESLARSLYRDPDTLPLVVACNGKGSAVYASSGYNVGLAQLLARIVRMRAEGTT